MVNIKLFYHVSVTLFNPHSFNKYMSLLTFLDKNRGRREFKLDSSSHYSSYPPASSYIFLLTLTGAHRISTFFLILTRVHETFSVIWVGMNPDNCHVIPSSYDTPDDSPWHELQLVNTPSKSHSLTPHPWSNVSESPRQLRGIQTRAPVWPVICPRETLNKAL